MDCLKEALWKEIEKLLGRMGIPNVRRLCSRRGRRHI